MKWYQNYTLLRVEFVFVHLLLIIIGLNAPGFAFGDVTSVYKFWSDYGLDSGQWFGIQFPWIYPLLAIVPMLIPHLVSGVIDYTVAWLFMVTILDYVALSVITNRGRSTDRLWLGWAWSVFLLALGPVAIGRLDGVVVPLLLIALVLAWRHPVAAGAFVAVATWIKVWPVAIGMALIAISRRRIRILAGALGLSLAVVAAALLLGSGPNLWSFLTEQGSRGLQVEAVFATPWVWQVLAGTGGAYIFYDNEIYTNQVSGLGVEQAAALTMPLMAWALAIVVLGVFALRLLGTSSRALMPPTITAVVTLLIVFNKVGSPQFISWLALPLIVGLAYRGRRFWPEAAMIVVTGVLTQIIYPYLYGYLLNPVTWMVVVFTARNALLVVLFAAALAELGVIGWRTVSARRRSRVSAREPIPEAR